MFAQGIVRRVTNLNIKLLKKQKKKQKRRKIETQEVHIPGDLKD
jgi:hypothetical protein